MCLVVREKSRVGFDERSEEGVQRGEECLQMSFRGKLLMRW